MRRALPFFCSACAAGCAALPHDGPVTAQRPFFSTDTATPPERAFELEAGVLVDPDDSTLVPAVLKYGADERTEVFLGWAPYQHVELEGRDDHGAGDITLGVKRRFLDAEEGRPALGTQIQLKLPTGERGEGLGTGELDVTLGGIATQMAGGWHVSTYGELAALGQHGAEDPDAGFAVALGAASPMFGRFALFGEVGRIWVPEQDFEPAFATLGTTWNPCRWLVLDLGCVVGLNDDMPDFQLTLGFTESLGRLLP